MTDPIRRSQELMRAELPKKFYQTATVEQEGEGFAVKLDGRGVKTPGRNPLILPTPATAEMVRAEWQAQEKVIDPAKMPVTRLANTVIDGVAQNADAVFEEIIAYAGNDMLFYRAESPEELVARQAERWDPVLDWVAEEFGARFVLVEGIMFSEQPTESIAAFRIEIDRHRAPFALGSLHVMTTLTGSALVTLALARRRLTLDEAWALANLEEDWTIEHWGEDAEAAARRAKRFEDMKAAHDLFVSLG
ncbi:MAG: ATPase [Martelella sp.]|uniref:ATP12 family chaperone protein n=1 Tax=unclassified Martelella TaxID=2629616 RepID=UPI000C503CDB|nr:ATP12 family protein [Martelella sp.]MAU21782.1 ATPase [Martelella sp.]